MTNSNLTEVTWVIDITVWMQDFLQTLNEIFANRVWFVGLQGSYGRGEATETSDIDVVVILDELSASDIQKYNTMLDALPHREMICGFLSGKDELLNWEPSDLFQFYYDTSPIQGSLDELLAVIDETAVIYADRLVVRRFDVRDGREYTDAPVWTIPLPFNPATAPYRRDRTVRAEPVPQFAAGAKLSAEVKGDPCERLEISFPKAEGPHGVYIYRLEIEDDKGCKLARQDEFGQFWLPSHERQPMLTYSLSSGYFDAGRTYRIVVTPVNCFGVGGRPISAEVKAVRSDGALLWESVDPMKECRFMAGLSGGKPVPVKDGWYQMSGGNHRMEIPPEVWKGKAGTRFRFVVDLEMDQPGTRTWTIVLRNPDPLKNANARIATPRGKSGKQRYVIEFAKQGDDFRYYLLIREGEAGRLRINYARLERLPEKMQ